MKCISVAFLLFSLALCACETVRLPGATGPGSAACYKGGCSGQVCSDRSGVITTCEWRPEYACYANARCERQVGGACGWTKTPQLESCLQKPPAQ